MSDQRQLVSTPPARRSQGGDSLADVLDRVLDKGVVIAGDIAVALVGVELLTIKIRLLVASADKAQEMGIDWWRTDPFLAGKQLGSSSEEGDLAGRIERLEAQLADSRADQPAKRRAVRQRR